VLFRRRALGEQSGAEQRVGARVRKSRQKEAAGAANAGLMQIEWSAGEVLKLAGVGGPAFQGIVDRVCIRLLGNTFDRLALRQARSRPILDNIKNYLEAENHRWSAFVWRTDRGLMLGARAPVLPTFAVCDNATYSTALRSDPRLIRSQAYAWIRIPSVRAFHAVIRGLNRH